MSDARSSSIFHVTLEPLRALCRALFASHETQVVQLYELLTDPWGRESISTRSGWRSSVGDDGSPVEFSLAIDQSPELRVMVEPIGRAPSLGANSAAALTLLDVLARRYPVHVHRLAAVSDIFLPEEMRGAFALWIAVGISGAQPPQFKVYLNPQIEGVARAAALVEEAMSRLGLADTRFVIRDILTRRGPDLDELKYFSLDLDASERARVKVYARHHRATVADLEAAASGCLQYSVGDVTSFLEVVAPGVASFEARPLFTCYAFVEGGGDRPASVTTHFPIAGYERDPRLVRQRVVDCLQRLGLETETYERCMAAWTSSGRDVAHAYTSFRRDQGRPRLTVYLPVELPGGLADG